jgi:hypothetical protein
MVSIACGAVLVFSAVVAPLAVAGTNTVNPTPCYSALQTASHSDRDEAQSKRALDVADQSDKDAQNALFDAKTKNDSDRGKVRAAHGNLASAKSELKTIESEPTPHDATWESRRKNAATKVEDRETEFQTAQSNAAASHEKLVVANNKAKEKRDILLAANDDYSKKHDIAVRNRSEANRLCAGKPGVQGAPGKDGAPGRDGVVIVREAPAPQVIETHLPVTH